MHGKPAPDIFLLAAKLLGLPAEDCYVFEDGIHGVHAGLNADCSTIMVPDLIPPTADLQNRCTGIYDNLSEVLKALQTKAC